MPGLIRISVDETCHVVWQVRSGRQSYYIHAIGDGPVGNCVTSDSAEKRFHQGRCITPWLPVFFSHRAVMPGIRSLNCVTAAARAMCRGWFYWG